METLETQEHAMADEATECKHIAASHTAEQLLDNYLNLLEEASDEPGAVILTKDFENVAALELLEFYGDEEVMYLQYTPETVHYIAKTILDNSIKSLTIYDFKEFFSYPLLVMRVRKALEDYDYKDFHVSFPDLDDILPEALSADLTLTSELFHYVELIFALESFNIKTGINIEVLDFIYDSITDKEAVS